MEKLIITCAITGGLHGKVANPNIPEQPDEQIQQTIDAWNAGAAIVHIHTRDEKGNSVQDVAKYKYIKDELRRRGCDIIVQNTTGGGIGMTNDERLCSIEADPEMASLNMGTTNYPMGGDKWFLASFSPADLIYFAEKMKARKVKPEMEVYNPAMLKDVRMLIEMGLIEKPYYVDFVMGMPAQNTMDATYKNLFFMIDQLPPDSIFNVCAVGRHQIPMTTFSILAGGNARVGLEDNIFYSKGELVKSNAQLVERTVRIANELQRPIASPAEARTILGLPQLAK